MLHGSFAATYRGHGTDLALTGGLLGFAPDDERIRDAFGWACREGLEVCFNSGDLGDVHPNTVRFSLVGETGKTLNLVGSSVGGGKVEITEILGLQVALTGEMPTIVTTYADMPGIIAAMTSMLAEANINIAAMRVTRTGRGETAICIIETDQEIPGQVVDTIGAMPEVLGINAIHPEF